MCAGSSCHSDGGCCCLVAGGAYPEDEIILPRRAVVQESCRDAHYSPENVIYCATLDASLRHDERLPHKKQCVLYHILELTHIALPVQLLGPIAQNNGFSQIYTYSCCRCDAGKERLVLLRS